MATCDDNLARTVARVDEALARLRAGEFVIVVDDEADVDSGDLVLAARFATPERVNFMTRSAGGLLCVALTAERLKDLGIGLMPGDSEGMGRAAFAVPVDARSGVRTGDSAEDRARTIALLIDRHTQPYDLTRPGHVHPVQAALGGVLQRAGHTEAAVDLCRLAGLEPAGVTSQILDNNGHASSMEDLRAYAAEHEMHMLCIADVIQYRRRMEKLVVRVSEAGLPTVFGLFRVVVYRSTVDGTEYVAVVKGDIGSCEAPLVRVHSGCVTGDVLGSVKCDCGWQLHAALKMIEEEGCGVVVYIPSHEGRGIGLANKIRAYHLQDRGMDTVEANVALGYPPDMRDYGFGAQVLTDLGVRRMRLMSNNPRKFAALQGYGLEVVERVPLEAPATEYNWRYLLTKREKMGHMLGGPDAPEV